MDQETENKINEFALHLIRLASELRSIEHHSTAKDVQAAAELIMELTRSISFEGMKFHLETKLP